MTQGSDTAAGTGRSGPGAALPCCPFASCSNGVVGATLSGRTRRDRDSAHGSRPNGGARSAGRAWFENLARRAGVLK